MKSHVILCLVVALFAGRGYALCVTADLANLRDGPGARFKKTWTVGKYTPLVKIGSKGSWYKVKDMDGEVHWVHRNLVTSRGMRCLAVQVPVANLRTGPGSNHSIAEFATADKYTPFKRIDLHEDGWYRVEDEDGQKFWIHQNIVWRPVKVMNIGY